MDDPNANPAGDGGNNNSGTTPPADGGFKPITSQDDLNRVIADRISRERGKFADYNDLKAKADKLAEIEAANKTEAEKAEERAAKAEGRAADAEARALRREVALEHKLTKDDAALLDAITDEDAMRRLAERLAAGAESSKKKSNHVPREGTSPTSTDSTEREFARSLFAGD